MLSETEIKEIRGHLEKAQNPIFYYDNDADGLCSFILLRKYIGRGKGVVVRSYPDLNAQYAKKTQELKADYVFILDKPSISQEFIDEMEKVGIPIVWIDHHDVPLDIKKNENIFIYNPAKSSEKSVEPVTYLSYEITKQKENLWLALIGCISDHYLPSFAKEFEKEYPDLWAKNIKEPFQALYETEIGKIAKSLNFGLKDSLTHVIEMQNFLIACKSPRDVFQEVWENRNFRKKYVEINKKYESLLDKAKNNISKKILFFKYSGELSISSEISNELSFLYPKKYIIVAYTKDNITNISIRGEKVKSILEEIKKEMSNITGGGHENAVGARIQTDDLETFKNKVEEKIKDERD